MIPRKPRTSAEILAAAIRDPPYDNNPGSPQFSVFSVNQNRASNIINSPRNSTSAGSTTFPRLGEPASSLLFRQVSAPAAPGPEIQELGLELETTAEDETILLSSEISVSEESSADEAVRKSTPRVPVAARIRSVLSTLRECRLGPFDLIMKILDEHDPNFQRHRMEFYKQENQTLSKVLDAVLGNELGKKKFRAWLETSSEALDLICTIVSDEMDSVHDVEQLSGLADITPEFIESWSISSNCEIAPFTTDILLSAAQSPLAKERNKKKKPDTMCNIVMKQLSYQRSNRALGFAAQFGLFLWSSGCSRRTIDALHQCGLSVSYPSVLNNIAALASHCMQLARQVASSVHIFCYDNINLSTSIFVEQRGASGQAKVTSGTFGVIYKVRNGTPDNMLLAPIMEQFKRYRTEQYPIRITTIEEASVRGNILFHDDVYSNQLKRTHEELSKYAIPSINDQLTNSRIRSAQVLRARDLNPWTRREVFQLGIGLFHLCLNLVWALLHTHRGSLEQTGSLTYFFALLEKTRLGGEHPDYHTILTALMQILDGLLLNAWRNECGHPTLTKFAKSEPSTEELLCLSGKILHTYALPLPETDDDDNTLEDESGSESDGDCATTGQQASSTSTTGLGHDPDKDRVNQNIRLLTRDLLYVAAVVGAISDGDIGRVEDLFPQLAMMFRGAGGNKYCTEILHLIMNLKHVWTPGFADVMRDNMLVNLTGLAGHSMAIDINMEHNIKQVKELLEAKGLDSTWDRLGDISAAIDYLNKVKKRVSSMMKLSYQNKNHSDVDTTHLVWRVADKTRDEDLQSHNEKRQGNAKIKAVIDIIASGDAKLKSVTLGTFNRKLAAMVEGRLYEEEDDTLPQVSLNIDNDT